MLTLALETSTPSGSLALYDGETLVETHAFEAHRGHNSKIFAPLQSMLADLSGHHLARLVVGTGPGSYTGVRIAIAIADALALSHHAKLVGCSSMLAATIGATASHYWIVGDARRDTWYRAEIRDGALVGAITAEGRSLWEAAVEGALAAGIPVRTFDAKPPLDGVLLDSPTAKQLGRVSFHQNEQEGPVEPIYLAAPYITEAKKLGKVLTTSQYRKH